MPNGKLEPLSAYEQETIINFNKDEPIAYVYTFEKTWQKHIEQKLGIKPSEKNDHGGRSYIVPKARIRMPQPKRILSEKAKNARIKSLAKARHAKQLELV